MYSNFIANSPTPKMNNSKIIENFFIFLSDPNFSKKKLRMKMYAKCHHFIQFAKKKSTIVAKRSYKDSNSDMYTDAFLFFISHNKNCLVSSNTQV